MVAFLIILIEILYAFGVLFTACELGQRLNFAFDECNEMIGEFEWYKFPIEIQRMLPMLMCLAQQPVEIQTFGSVALKREAFKYVSSF